MPSTPSSGITTTPSGDRHIPSSTRPDGSKRKEIKIRPGYKPPEDVEIYKNRTAEAWKTRGVGAGVPGAAAVTGSGAHEESKGVNAKNAKRREARKRATKEAGDEAKEGVVVAQETSETTKYGEQKPTSSPPPPPPPPLTSGLAQKTRESDAPPLPTPPPSSSEPPDPEAEREKQARALKKKLRQARELREKQDKGGDLLPEQFEKVIRINELIRQLDGLGFDADGQRKGGLDGGRSL